MEREGVLVHFHGQKEIENYLLCRHALCRAVKKPVRRRTGHEPLDVEAILDLAFEAVTAPLRAQCSGQYVARYCDFHRPHGKDQTTLASDAIAVFDQKWDSMDTRLQIVPGKDVLGGLRKRVQDEYQVSLTDFLDAFRPEDVASDLAILVRTLDGFRASPTKQLRTIQRHLRCRVFSVRPRRIPRRAPPIRTAGAAAALPADVRRSSPRRFSGVQMGMIRIGGRGARGRPSTGPADRRGRRARRSTPRAAAPDRPASASARGVPP